MRLSFTILFITACLTFVYPQATDSKKVFSISGFVHDAENDSYLGATSLSLQPGNKHIQADTNGFFSFENLSSLNYMLTIRFIGYNDLSVPIALSKDTLMHLHLQPSLLLLQEVRINAQRGGFNGAASSLPVTEISKNYLLKNSSTNFIQTLSSIAGISSMDIGAGFSKPVIRGYGFNRVAVVDKGVVQQNQQWGADHGIEIDQFDVDGVRVHKGPMSLFYGSDAIGGVIEILTPVIPFEDMFWGDATLIAKSNNDLFGVSVSTSVKRGNLFVRGRATVQSYSDYRVPADTIEYLSWRLPVYNGRMKNTAGREFNLAFSGNYSKDNFSSWLHLSDIYSKNGFYPGAHGIPSLERVAYDGSLRNIEMPHATSNHYKLIWNSELMLMDNDKLMFDVGYQLNRREELSAFHTHYGNQEAPVLKPDLELQFRLNTLSGSARYVMDEDERWSRTVGASMEFQHNRVGGYSFLLPNFERLSGGLFWINSVRLNEMFMLTGGLRYDMGRLNISEFYDPLLAEFMMLQGYSQENVEFYAMRSANLNREFGDLSGSLGLEYRPAAFHTLKMNAGRSFRYPGANELASNGLHHGAFRHELGNGDLGSESGYQLDIDYMFEKGGFNVRVNPFVSWFKNYIYMEPTGNWSVLPHAGQIYLYNETEAVMAGGELMAGYEISNSWSVNSDFEYVFNRNISDNYALPFTPPAVVTNDITYSGNGKNNSLISNYEIKLENRWVMNQTSVARNEVATPGASLWNLSAYVHWHVGGKMFITLLQVDNIFNTSFMNHLSFYRKLNAPEPSRNIQLIVKIPF
jgi:iron complex outermembrane receptor protein